MNDNYGLVIGMGKKLKKYKEITRKLLNNEKLTPEERAYLKKEGIQKRRK